MGTTINDTPETTVSGLLRVTFRNGAPVRLLADGMSRDEFYDFCLANPELRIERTADNQLIIMPPTGSETGNRNSEIHLEIGIWNRKTKLGYTFDSSTGFTLPNGAERAPDTAWIRKDRWEALNAEEKKKFAPIVPDFVLELRSEGQNMGELREKMGEYMGAGCRLGWLIDPSLQCTYVYDEHGSVQTVPFSETLDGGEVMPGLLVRWAEVLG
jgi:Uma2 family endonuclease